jgi:hypothetical protein
MCITIYYFIYWGYKSDVNCQFQKKILLLSRIFICQIKYISIVDEEFFGFCDFMFDFICV